MGLSEPGGNTVTLSAHQDGAQPQQQLRHVKKDILMPNIMRKMARERCSEQVQDFTKCCKNSGILMVVKYWKENSALKDPLNCLL